MNKSCNHCGRATYKVKGWWTDAEVIFVCLGCNLEETGGCQCPPFISGISPAIPSFEEDEPPQPINYGIPTGFPEHDDEPRTQ